MGCEFLNAPTHTKTYTEIFEENFPFYLAIGMSYEEYWERDCSLTQYFLRAYRIKQEEVNNNAWLQGLYVYDAVSTAVNNALRGKNQKAKEYAKQPFNFKNNVNEPPTPEQVEIEQEKALAWMESLVRINRAGAVEPEPK